MELDLLVNGVQTAVLADDGGTAIPELFLNDTDQLKYRLRLWMPGLSSFSILHATPVIDDVTIYFTRGTQYLSYAIIGE